MFFVQAMCEGTGGRTGNTTNYCRVGLVVVIKVNGDVLHIGDDTFGEVGDLTGSAGRIGAASETGDGQSSD